MLTSPRAHIPTPARTLLDLSRARDLYHSKACIKKTLSSTKSSQIAPASRISGEPLCVPTRPAPTEQLCGVVVAREWAFVNSLKSLRTMLDIKGESSCSIAWKIVDGELTSSFAPGGGVDVLNR